MDIGFTGGGRNCMTSQRTQSRNEQRFCCGQADLRPVYEVRSFTIARCLSCGLGRTLLDREFDFQKYYAESFFQGGVDDGYADYLGSEIALRTEVQNVLAYLLKKAHGRASLMEFGCAYGFFLQEA